MGCATSKIDDLPAVLLCRHRLDFLNQALHHRYSLSDCHVSYIHSLNSVGLSLHRFFESSSTLPPPIVTKTPLNDAVDDLHHHRHSSSSGHLHFHSDDSDDHLHHDTVAAGGGGHLDDISDSGSDVDSPLHHHNHLPPSTAGKVLYNNAGVGGANGGGGGFAGVDDGQPYSYPYTNPYSNPYSYGGGGGGGDVGGGGGFMHMNYMKRHVTPSVSYEQKPAYAETVQFGEPYNNYGNPYGFMNYGGGGGGGGGGASTSKQVATGAAAAAAAAPPPPPPPSTSAWDFLNPFESIEASYPPYTPSSRDSREVREEEGIPDLEDEDFDHEVVKEVVHGHQKLVVDDNVIGRPSTSGHKKSGGHIIDDDDDDGHVGDIESLESSDDDDHHGHEAAEAVVEGGGRTSGAGEYEVKMVDKKVVGADGEKGGGGGGGGGRGGGFKSVFEVVKEIQVQFERAAACGDHLSRVLEVGKLRYQRKNPAFHVSTKMLNVITPSLPSTSKDSEASADVNEDVQQLRSLNLSASMQKLYLWEKKLYEEVKTEEKMRVTHDRKVLKLQQLTERGAEPQKIESTRSMVRALSTKISIAIQIVDRISAKINKVRDEELWPQLNELIQGLSRMWKAMLECHRAQCEAIDAARGLDAIAFPSNPTDSHLEATLQLEHDLINWTCRFTDWVGAQKGYVRALNSWLLKLIHYEPEETADGIAPFSPGRAGAPPIFVICHQWNQSLERISETSEKEVINSMRVFAMMVWHFRERDKGEMKQRMTVNRDIERKVKNLDREDQRIQKEIQALDKKMELNSGNSDGLSLSGHVVYQSDTSSKSSLQAGLRSIFEALERFTADSVKVYEELIQRTEEVVRVHGTTS